MKSILAIALLCTPYAVNAASITPVSYSYDIAPNHGSAYKDDTYNGTTGELADGISATTDWQSTDGFGATGPNVGWLNVNPTITFVFDQAYDFGSMVVNIQDGQGVAGVGLAASFTVNGLTSPTLVGGVIAQPINVVMNLTSLADTNTLAVTINRAFEWTFVSEFTFDYVAPSSVPLPATLPLILAALGGMGALARRKTRTDHV